MILSARSITVQYGEVDVIRGVSMDIEDKGIAALIGANGAGKTTVLRAISGLKRATSGEIWFQGSRIDGKPPEVIAAMGLRYVPEGRRLFGSLTVLENLQMGAYLHQKGNSWRKDLEQVFGYLPILKERQKQKAESLSGGEQQLLALGRVLMAKPKLVLLDEPTWGLSPIMTKQVSRIISDMNKDGVSVVLVEQNALMALRLAQRGYVLETGRVVLADHASALLSNNDVRRAYLGM